MEKKIYAALSKARSVTIVALLGGMVALCLLQVVLRYFTSATLRPFAWGDEVIRLTSIWVAFLAASLGVREGSHLSVEFFLKKFLSDFGVKIVKKIAGLTVLTCLGLVVWFGVQQVQSNIGSMLQNLPTVSIAWFYAAIPVGGAYLFLDYLLILIHGKHPYSSVALAGLDAEEPSHKKEGN